MWEHFDFVYELFLNVNESVRDGKSYASFARFLGMSVGKVQSWRELKQWPKATDLAILHDKLGLSYSWLVTGEGDPFESSPNTPDAPAKPDPATLPAAPALELRKETTPFATPPAPTAVPMVGFASCGMLGWSGRMTYPVAIPLPYARPDMIAVMAQGESLIPEGIGHGHICFCDPHASPIEGECVYVEHKDGMSTLKAFLGRGEVGGEPSIRLKGWHDKEVGKPQKHFFIDVTENFITRIAPVVYVQRRL